MKEAAGSVRQGSYGNRRASTHSQCSFRSRARCLTRKEVVQDIEAVDPEYYKNLKWMLENDINDVLDLTFTEEVDYFGAVEMVELKPDGSGIKVSFHLHSSVSNEAAGINGPVISPQHAAYA